MTHYQIIDFAKALTFAYIAPVRGERKFNLTLIQYLTKDQYKLFCQNMMNEKPKDLSIQFDPNFYECAADNDNELLYDPQVKSAWNLATIIGELKKII